MFDSQKYHLFKYYYNYSYLIDKFNHTNNFRYESYFIFYN